MVVLPLPSTGLAGSSRYRLFAISILCDIDSSSYRCRPERDGHRLDGGKLFQ